MSCHGRVNHLGVGLLSLCLDLLMRMVWQLIKLMGPAETPGLDWQHQYF